MKTHISDKRSKAALILSFVLTGIISTSANAISVYYFVISEGIINTAGGFAGGGFGTLAVSGTFTATFTNTSIRFSDIDVGTNHPSSSFIFPYYEGTFDGLSFSGSHTIPMLGIDNSYSGTFDATKLNISGSYHEPYFDGYQYDFNINALGSPIPIPSAFLLFISCLGFLGLRGHRSASHV